MAFSAHVLQVLIASPSDTKEARDEVEKSLHSWNSSRAVREQIVLLPRRWESDSVPRMGEGDGQEVINRQLVDDSDIAVVIFNAKLGKATARDISGTAEELQRAIDQGKHVHVYFSDAPVPREALKSAEEVEAFKRNLESQGLYGTYSNAADLGFQVRNAVEADLQLMNLAAPTGRNVRAGADPVAEYKFSREQESDSRGRIRHRNRNTRIEVTNHGDVAAEDFTLTLTPIGEGDLPIMEDPHKVKPTIAGRGHFSYSVIPYAGSADALRAEMVWEENGESKTKTHTVSLTS